MNRLGRVTLIVPYYRNMMMLAEQASQWNAYPESVRVIVVDDGSPEPALPIIEANVTDEARSRLQLYRIGVDIPWNRGGARNLGSKMAETEWIVHVDIDHLLMADCARTLLDTPVNPKRWYRFNRYRRGRADETRRKDKIPDDQEFGLIEPHIDSYLIGREAYWKTGGYDEDYSGCLGGGSPFLKRLEEKRGKPEILPKDVFLCVYTRSVVADASDNTLDRDTSEYSRRRKVKEKTGNTKPLNPLRFPWTRVL